MTLYYIFIIYSHNILKLFLWKNYKIWRKKLKKLQDSSSSWLIPRDSWFSASSENDQKWSEISKSIVLLGNLSFLNFSVRWKMNESSIHRKMDNLSPILSLILEFMNSWIRSSQYSVNNTTYVHYQSKRTQFPPRKNSWENRTHRCSRNRRICWSSYRRSSQFPSSHPSYEDEWTRY